MRRERPERGGLGAFMRHACLVAVPLAAATVVALKVAWPLVPLSLARGEALSVVVLDRDDRLLRAYTTPDGRWRLPVAPNEVDVRYLAMLLAFEDKRFWSHRGVDPYALGRASLQLIHHRRIVSGGSTLTMQVARLLAGEHERSGIGKLR